MGRGLPGARRGLERGAVGGWAVLDRRAGEHGLRDRRHDVPGRAAAALPRPPGPSQRRPGHGVRRPDQPQRRPAHRRVRRRPAHPRRLRRALPQHRRQVRAVGGRPGARARGVRGVPEADAAHPRRPVRDARQGHPVGVPPDVPRRQHAGGDPQRDRPSTSGRCSSPTRARCSTSVCAPTPPSATWSSPPRRAGSWGTCRSRSGTPTGSRGSARSTSCSTTPTRLPSGLRISPETGLTPPLCERLAGHNGIDLG